MTATPPARRAGRFRRARTRDWATRARNFVVGGDEPVPSFIETLARSVSVGSTGAVDDARRRADALIAPDTGAVAMLDFGRIDETVAVPSWTIHYILYLHLHFMVRTTIMPLYFVLVLSLDLYHA